MGRHVAFLRGMNLGNRRITNEELRAHVSGLGFDAVATFRASGNVVFESGAGMDADQIAERLEGGLADALGYEVPVFLRSEAEVGEIASHRPFDPVQVEASKGKLQVGFLLRRPSAAARKRALSHSSPEDRLAVSNRELYWLPRGGISESELDLVALAADLGPTTIRTKGTVEQLTAKFFD